VATREAPTSRSILAPVVGVIRIGVRIRQLLERNVTRPRHPV
jgi:hypothetical protein